MAGPTVVFKECSNLTLGTKLSNFLQYKYVVNFYKT